MRLPYAVLKLSFNFRSSAADVFGWWTELEPKGYVGRSLKRISVLERAPGHAKVKTEWSFAGRRFEMDEELVIVSDRLWVWYSSFLGVPAKETFRLDVTAEGCTLDILSEMTPRSWRILLFLLIGWYWRRQDRLEWRAAAASCVQELQTGWKSTAQELSRQN